MTADSFTVTLQDVASAAGVSTSTASRALNGRADTYRISPHTVERVRQAASKLGFQPSQTARSLRLKRSGLIGVVVPDIANPFFSAITRIVTLAAEAEQYSVLIGDSREATEHEERHLQQFLARQVEALVVCPVGIEFSHLEAIQCSGLPLVLVDRCPGRSSLVRVTSDHSGGAAQAARLLIEQGHCHIGVLQGLPETLPNKLRLEGFRQQLEQAGLSLPDEMIAGDNFTETSGYQAACRLLDEQPQLTALFAFSTPNAFGALRAARERNRSVPDDLSIIAFDDSPHASFMATPLTTIAQDIDALGTRAVELIMNQLKTGKPPGRTKHQIGVTAIQRASVTKAKL